MDWKWSKDHNDINNIYEITYKHNQQEYDKPYLSINHLIDYQNIIKSINKTW
jgi:hypothetical protein